MPIHFRRNSFGQKKLFERGALFGIPYSAKCYGLTHVIKDAVRAGKLKEFWEWHDWIQSQSLEILQGLIQKYKAQPEEYFEERNQIIASYHYFKEIEYYQHGFLYKRHFKVEECPRDQRENVRKKSSSSVEIASYSNPYRRETLLATLQLLRETFDAIKPPLTQPILFEIVSCNHSNLLFYDPKTKKFTYISTNDLEESENFPREITDDQMIADLIESDFSVFRDHKKDRNIAIFNTKLFSAKEEAAQIRESIKTLQNTPAWQAIHAMTTEKASLDDYFQSNWLTIAAKEGQLELVKTLLIIEPSKLKQVDEAGLVPLDYAISYNQVEIVSILLQKGGKLSACYSAQKNKSLLFDAIKKGNKDIIAKLLEYGADPLILNEEGETAIQFAERLSKQPSYSKIYHPIIELLKEYGDKIKKDFLCVLQKNDCQIRSDIIDYFQDEKIQDNANKNDLYFIQLRKNVIAFQALDQFIFQVKNLIQMHSDAKRDATAVQALNEYMHLAYKAIHAEIKKNGHPEKIISDLKKKIFEIGQNLYRERTNTGSLLRWFRKINPLANAIQSLFKEKFQISPPKKMSPAPIEMARQKGWSCDIYATAAVLKKLHNDKIISQLPLPARKRDSSFATDSLRKHLKRLKANSFPDLKELRQCVLETHKEVTAEVYTERDRDDYFNRLQMALNQGLTPIVIFDVDSKTGRPTQAQGKDTHVAIVSKFYTGDDGKKYVDLWQWQREYKKISADDLFESTAQLESANEEVAFQKIRTADGEGAWFPKNQIRDFVKNPVVIKQQEPTLRKSQRCNILVIDSVHRTKQFIAKLDQQMKSFQFWHFTTLGKQQLHILKSLKSYLIKTMDQHIPLFSALETWQSTMLEDQSTTRRKAMNDTRYYSLSFLNPKKSAFQTLVEESRHVASIP